MERRRETQGGKDGSFTESIDKGVGVGVVEGSRKKGSSDKWKDFTFRWKDFYV